MFFCSIWSPKCLITSLGFRTGNHAVEIQDHQYWTINLPTQTAHCCPVWWSPHWPPSMKLPSPNWSKPLLLQAGNSKLWQIVHTFLVSFSYWYLFESQNKHKHKQNLNQSKTIDHSYLHHFISAVQALAVGFNKVIPFFFWNMISISLPN